MLKLRCGIHVMVCIGMFTNTPRRSNVKRNFDDQAGVPIRQQALPNQELSRILSGATKNQGTCFLSDLPRSISLALDSRQRRQGCIRSAGLLPDCHYHENCMHSSAEQTGVTLRIVANTLAANQQDKSICSIANVARPTSPLEWAMCLMHR